MSSMSTSTAPSITSMSASMSLSAPPTASATMSSMGGTSGMGGMDMENSCKIAMTWNWYTIGACFISKSWRVTSGGMFAGSCIGVICLVISLEFLRRLQREYDAFNRRRDQKSRDTKSKSESRSGSSTEQNSDPELNKDTANMRIARRPEAAALRPQLSRLTLFRRQLIRSALHMVQFGVAYFIMLLAMYYNGYIIICILIGAFLGSFVFSWDQLFQNENSRGDAADVTCCCG